MKHIAYYIGSATKGVAKATLPVVGWTTKQATSFATEFTRGMMEKPVSITDKNYRDENIDNEIKQELSSEPVQPELPGMNPQQPVRES